METVFFLKFPRFRTILTVALTCWLFTVYLQHLMLLLNGYIEFGIQLFYRVPLSAHRQLFTNTPPVSIRTTYYFLYFSILQRTTRIIRTVMVSKQWRIVILSDQQKRMQYVVQKVQKEHDAKCRCVISDVGNKLGVFSNYLYSKCKILPT